MINGKSFGRRCFNCINYMIMLLLSLSCILPFLHVFALSLSSSAAVSSGKVGLLPVGFTTASYQFILEDGQFFKSMFISVKRTILGTVINLLLVVFTAYPLSKPKEKVVGRNIYMVYFFITTLIGGGTSPMYLVVSRMGLLGSIWALILPGALSVHNMIIMMNSQKDYQQ